MEEIIQNEVTSAAFEFIKNRDQQVSAEPVSDYDKVRRSEDLDNSIFYGGDPSSIRNPKYTNLSESESQDLRPKITSSEIDEFEKMFKENVSPSVNFAKKPDGSIDFRLYKGESGSEASVRGSIPLQAEDKIDFTYSIQNGPHIDMSADLTQDVAYTLKRLSDFYVTWKKDWSEKLS